MARYTIPNTNISFNSHLKNSFELGSTNMSLNTVGGRIYPRVSGGGTGISEIRNRTVYALADVAIYDENSLTEIGGTVSVLIDTITLGPSTRIEVSPSYIIDYSQITLITLACSVDSGYTFNGWRNAFGDLISSMNPVELDLNTLVLYNATLIRAHVSI